MKGYRFYLECKDRQKCVSTGNVIAVSIGDRPKIRNGKRCYKGLSRQTSYPNSPVASANIALEFLRKYCVRVSEAMARKVHPVLFELLDRRKRPRSQ
jgi:hypothetical protein